jgi:hypothetical protein
MNALGLVDTFWLCSARELGARLAGSQFRADPSSCPRIARIHSAHACRFTWTIAQLVEKGSNCVMPYVFQLGNDAGVVSFKDSVRSLSGLLLLV